MQMKALIARMYEENRFLLDGNLLSENEKKMYQNVTMYMSDVEAVIALVLCVCIWNDVMGKSPLFFWMNMTPRCRRHISMDTGKNLPDL